MKSIDAMKQVKEFLLTLLQNSTDVAAMSLEILTLDEAINHEEAQGYEDLFESHKSLLEANSLFIKRIQELEGQRLIQAQSVEPIGYADQHGRLYSLMVVKQLGMEAGEMTPIYTHPAPAKPPQADAQTGCTRSHPHENMSPMCDLRTEIARLNFEAAQKVRHHQEPSIHAGCSSIDGNLGTAVSDQQVAAPPGWVIVPVKPTNVMVKVMLDWGTKKSEWEAILADAPKPPKAGLVPMTEPELDDLLPTNDSMSRTDALRWVARATERKHGIEVNP